MERTTYTRHQITERVTQILSENYFDTPPVDMRKLLENYGIVIHERTFPLKHANISGFVTFADDDKTAPVFVINKSDSNDRKKFTLAHEFGHWILHKQELIDDPALSILYKSPLGSETTDQIEIEANQFAAQLLVPDAMLRAEHENTSEHKKDLAEKFKVGEDIIGFRLGLRDDEQSTDEPVQ
jgi:Zn-dependent peptidase ImmA (M78 family)